LWRRQRDVEGALDRLGRPEAWLDRATPRPGDDRDLDGETAARRDACELQYVAFDFGRPGEDVMVVLQKISDCPIC
jgi:hypothetical protein